ncbi:MULTISPECIES: helix-turn-helix domain-containing protein [Pseudanabaena]|jgi:predicted HTH transcriptional regulator|uniref:AlbA family DNA-binding domain-containing protein n=1 Tax=Pseudanabaena TaxID=1152 RepID=UPI00247965A8|nr:MULTISPECIES: ATP-binding protein [Pseudanabaena]MEA5490198.1 ATP-binding protein [Pseudanabaena sp. CCNP1317]WGS72466.1 ATP-binding protein [Pseudanabaena galeata CCNP1313]
MMQYNPPKLAFKEEFARFLENPSRESLRLVVQNQIGEQNELDFKEMWNEKEKTIIAKHILAFANTNSGCIIFGVSEKEDKTFDIKGLANLIDKTEIKNRVKKYIPESVLYDIYDFDYSESEYSKLTGKKFQVLHVNYNPNIIPVLAIAEGDSLRPNAVYIRHNNSSSEANYSQLQSMINKRIEDSRQPTKGRALKEHLSELEALYEKNSRFASIRSPFETSLKADFYKFIDKMIAKKQEIIERIINSSL